MKEPNDKDGRVPNRLINSSSPYLLQHAYNPVDWYAWGSEALEKAINSDMPIIVSIGYSACHWCHVMEHESFENDEIAAIMNRDFICIKVDREERPDVDNIYMDAVHAMGLQGGWPLNVFLLPDQKPFYGGTYFPSEGWRRLLNDISTAFRSQRQKIEESAIQFANALSIDEAKKYQLKEYERAFNNDLLDQSVQKLVSSLDSTYGGQSKAPKFPMPSIWSFLLQYQVGNKQDSISSILILTLQRIIAGGIYDTLRGGFSRYSVDEKWFAPHFEKMLYDNAQLVGLYSDAYSYTKNSDFQKTVEQTVGWLKDEMSSQKGAFYSALDADSEGVEGKFYTWKSKEVDAILEYDSQYIKEYFNFEESGNWENGVNILFRTKSDSEFINKHDFAEADWQEILESSKARLLVEREKRIRPGLDDKIILAWNAMMISGLCKGFHATSNDQYLKMASACANFIEEEMTQSDGSLTRIFGSRIKGMLDDYAFLIEASLLLYQSSFETKWYALAKTLTKYCVTNFFDKESGLFYYTASNHERLIARKKEIFDNVIPSSNSQMAINLRIMGAYEDNDEWIQISSKMIQAMQKHFDMNLAYTANWAKAFLLFTRPLAEVIIVGTEAKTMASEISTHYYPNKIVVASKDGSEAIPLLKDRPVVKGKTTIYVCFDRVCKLPVQSVKEALEQLPGFEQTTT